MESLGGRSDDVLACGLALVQFVLSADVFEELNYFFFYTPVAVVGCRPHGEHGFIEMPLVALHDQLVSPADHVDVVGRVELGDHVTAEQVAGASGTHPPASSVWWTYMEGYQSAKNEPDI